MINKIEFKNFKAFSDASIKIAPITLIYGKNSSGKSSILKLLQLLKVIACKRVFAGELPGVSVEHSLDLGNFKDYIYNHDETLSIEIKLFCEALNNIKYHSKYFNSQIAWQDGGNQTGYLFDIERQIVSIKLMHSVHRPQGYISEIYRHENSDHAKFIGIKHDENSLQNKYSLSHKRICNIDTYNFYRNNCSRIIDGFDTYCDYKALLEIDSEFSTLRELAHKFGYDPTINKRALSADVLIKAGYLSEDSSNLDGVQQTKQCVTRDKVLIENNQAVFKAISSMRMMHEYEQALGRLRSRFSSTIDFFSRDFSFDQFVEWSSSSYYTTTFRYGEGFISRGRVTDTPFEDEFIKYSYKKVGWTDELTDSRVESGSSNLIISLINKDNNDKSISEPPIESGRLDVNGLASALSNMLQSECSAVYSIGPARASPQSIYRLNVVGKYVGHDGASALAFLMNSDISLMRVNEWLEKLCGYKVSCHSLGERASGHFSVYLVRTDKHSKLENRFADVGYGVSQILPIIVQSELVMRSIITIEQPELHVHPALQADMAEYFVDSYKKNGNHFVIETHSEHLMLRIQKLIRKGALKPEDVSVLYVSRGEDGSNISNIRLDADGKFFDLWPGEGFFPERFNELMPD